MSLAAFAVGCSSHSADPMLAVTMRGDEQHVLVWFCGDTPDRFDIAKTEPDRGEVLSDIERFASGTTVAHLEGSELDGSPVVIDLGPVTGEPDELAGFVYQAEWYGGAVSVLNPATKQWNDLPPRPWPETPEAFVQDPSDPGSGTLVTTDDPERLADPCTD